MNSESSAVLTAVVNNKTISYRRVGQGARRILFFHGFPGSSSQIEAFRAQLGTFDLDVVCVDRPGYHKTEAEPGNQFEQTSKLIKGLLDTLGWTSCEIMSVSGGTPFIFSFTQAYPQFVTRFTVVSGLGPVGNKEFERFLSWKAKLVMSLLPKLPGALFVKVLPKQKAESRASKFDIIRYLLPASPADTVAMQDSGIQTILSRTLHEAFMQKGVGPKRDAIEYLSPWSLDLNSYLGPIDIWHGDEDQILPVEMAEQMASLLPRANLRVLPNEGHYSLIIKRTQNILEMGTH